MPLFVFYDVSSDKHRHKVMETCRDFGLQWLQYSGFRGELSLPRRKELASALRRCLGDEPGSIVIVPVCERDERSILEIVKLVPENVRAAKLSADRDLRRRIRELRE